MKNITNEIVKNFENYLYEEERCDNTIKKYMHDIRFFCEWLGGKDVDKSYKKEFCENCTPKSINLILSSLNSLCMYMNWYELEVSTRVIVMQDIE